MDVAVGDAVKPEVIEFIKWQIGVGVTFFSLVIAWIAFADKRRTNREASIAKATEERERARDALIQERIAGKERADQDRWQRTDSELRNLQIQMRALELELARNFMPREGVEHLIQQIANNLSAQIGEIKEGLAALTNRLLEQHTIHDPPRRR